MLLQNTKVKTHMLYQYTNFIQFLFTHFLPISCQKLSIIHTRIMPLEYQNNSNLEILIVISLINSIPNSLHYYSQNSLQYNAKKKNSIKPKIVPKHYQLSYMLGSISIQIPKKKLSIF